VVTVAELLGQNQRLLFQYRPPGISGLITNASGRQAGAKAPSRMIRFSGLSYRFIEPNNAPSWNSTPNSLRISYSLRSPQRTRSVS
jgi:hypothetical protein